MRKTTILVLAALLMASATGAALDIAIGAGYDYQLAVITDFTGYLPLQEHAARLDLRAWPYPLQLGIGFARIIIGPLASPAGSFMNAVLTADYWLLDLPLGSLPLSMHLGAGVWASLPVLGFGLRGVAGLRFAPFSADRGFELFLSFVPSVGGYLAPSRGLVAGGSAGLGARYWFGR